MNFYASLLACTQKWTDTRYSQDKFLIPPYCLASEANHHSVNIASNSGAGPRMVAKHLGIRLAALSDAV
jgi:hypothetical protein